MTNKNKAEYTATLVTCGLAGAVLEKVIGVSEQVPYAQKAQKRRKSKLVIQGSHMVSGTRCPARSDSVMTWSESRAAAPKGRCPVGHRGEFPYVLRGHIWGYFP